ncbi:hypothetical protein GCM10010409_50460 [Mycolicibacterium diernhoferi]
MRNQSVWQQIDHPDGQAYQWRDFTITGKPGNWTLYRDGQAVIAAKYRVDLERRASKLRRQESAAVVEERDRADDGLRVRQPFGQQLSSVVSGGLPGSRR